VAAARAQLEKQRAELTSMRESYEERLAALTAEVEAANKDKATREEVLDLPNCHFVLRYCF
jgi:uncharacterized protein YhaN